MLDKGNRRYLTVTLFLAPCLSLKRIIHRYNDDLR